MKYLSALFGTALFVLLASTASQVRADYLSWTYTAQSNVPGISASSSSNGGASVSLVDYNTPQSSGTSIPVQAYTTSSSNSTPVNFGPSTEQPTSFNLALKITDSNGASGTLNFTGTLAGAMTFNSSSVVASFLPTTSDLVNPNGQAYMTFGGHTYTVSIAPQTLAPPTSTQQDIMASVSVTNRSGGGGGDGGNPPPPHGTPEPTSLLLGSLGFSFFGAGCWWKRRRLARV